MTAMNLQHLLFGVIFINIINLSSSTLSSTEGNNNKYGWDLDIIKYCEKKQVTIRKEINVLVKICVLDEERAFVHPVFVIQSLNDGQLNYNEYYGTWENQLKVDFFAKKILKKVKEFPYHAHRKFEYMKIDAVRFVVKTFQNAPKNMKPCFFLGPKDWKIVTENETSATLTLYSSKKKDNYCLKTLPRSDVIGAVKVEYQVISKDNEIRNFQGNLVIVKESKFKITIQRRSSGSVLFAKNWKDYVKGFGDTTNFWLGLEKIHQLTKNGSYNLRMEAKTYVNDTLWFANYDTVIVGSSADYYRLTVNKLLDTNTAKESTNGLMYNNNQKFSTFDSDNDGHSGSCSDSYRGDAGFWFNKCGYVNPNGIWYSKRTNDENSMYWYSTDDWNSLKYISLILIPK